jgi:osmotically-inducible protein OsmY
MLLLSLSACGGTTQEIDLSDPGIKARIEAQLRGRKDLDLRYVTVDVTDGAATISGMVPTREQIREIDHLVKRTKGVEAALINLVVNE